MAMIASDSSHHGVVENGPNEMKQERQRGDGQLGASWYFSRREIEENSPSRRDGIDLKKESYLRRSYCSFLQELGMKLKVPQVTIATAMVFCHRFYLRQSHAKNDRRTIATVCLFLAGKVEETPRPLKDVIQVSYEVIHKKDPTAGQRIKQQREIYDKQKELLLLGERIVLVTLGFDLNVNHAYKPLVEAIRRFNVSENQLPQVAWNFVNDGLRTSLCLQFKPHHIAAGAIFLAAKFLKVKLPSNGDKIWWQDFDVTPRQLEEISNQMLELYEHNRSSQAQPSDGNEAEGSSASVHNQRSSVKLENHKESSAHGYQASKQSNLRSSSSTGASDAKQTDTDKQISEHKVLRNGNGDQGSNKDKNCLSGGILDAGIDSSHNGKKSLPDHHCSKSGHESDPQEDMSNLSHNNPNETIDGIPNCNEAPSVSSSMMDAMNKIDKDKVKAALEKRRKSKGDVALKANVIDDDDLLERELEHGVELAVENEKIKQEEQEHSTFSGSTRQEDIQNADQVENGHYNTCNVPVTIEDVNFPVNINKKHSPQLPKAEDGEFPIIKQECQQITEQSDGPLAGKYEDGRDCKKPKLEA